VYRKAIVREYDNRFIDGSMDNAGFYQLDVDINAISFSHHHLFSREHVLAQRLTQLFDQYIAGRGVGNANILPSSPNHSYNDEKVFLTIFPIIIKY
jgi:coiled-coil and C2 domain-containing protein 2A